MYLLLVPYHRFFVHQYNHKNVWFIKFYVNCWGGVRWRWGSWVIWLDGVVYSYLCFLDLWPPCSSPFDAHKLQEKKIKSFKACLWRFDGVMEHMKDNEWCTLFKQHTQSHQHLGERKSIGYLWIKNKFSFNCTSWKEWCNFTFFNRISWKDWCNTFL